MTQNRVDRAKETLERGKTKASKGEMKNGKDGVRTKLMRRTDTSTNASIGGFGERSTIMG